MKHGGRVMKVEEREKLGNKGFSLVEIIIVVAIMAVLAAALAPQIIKYIERSRANVCQHNMGMIKEAVQLEISELEKAYNKYGTITDLTQVELYDGTKCESGGTYSVDVIQLEDCRYSIDISCSKHGAFNGN
jgi:prepilin-type N-terminal cleavage/methylation domain-containing protein